MKPNQVIQGDALQQLKGLPEKSINMCMTSPPYWALRDYGVEGQLGLEPTFDEYISKLCDIFDEVKRVLRDDGTCWVNIGDTYGGSRGEMRTPGSIKEKEQITLEGNKVRDTSSDAARKSMGDLGFNYELQGTTQKSLVMIPFHFAIEMVNRGWILRNTIIWHKRNCMPSSVKDRFTVDFEYIFFFSKKKNYYFETQFENYAESTSNDNRFDKAKQTGIIDLVGNKKIGYSGGKNIKEGYEESKSQNPIEVRNSVFNKGLGEGRNKRTVWTINPKPFSEAHFAVYPEELCETPIKAGCPEDGIVLDPFFGAGTTGLVALKQNKKFIGIELNKEYIEIAKKRLKPYLEQTKL